MDNYRDLKELCDTLSDELAEANDKIRQAGGKLSGADLDYVDKLTHALKSIKTTMAMMEAEGSYDGYNGASGRYMPHYSYGRARDRMGRYMSRDDDMVAQLREMMGQAKDDRTRMELQKVVDKLER